MHGTKRPYRYGLGNRIFNAVRGLFTVALPVAALAATPVPSATAQEMHGSPIHLLVVGDSLTAGYGLAEADSFPARLEDALRAAGHDVEVVNAGVSGDTTAGGLSRIEWLLGEDPDAVIVELGANDGLRGIDPAETKRNLDTILSRLDEAGLPVLLAGMRAPPNFGSDYQQAFDAIYPRLAERHGAILYPFFLAGVATEPALNQDDAKHPNEAGVRVIVERILPYVERLLARTAED